MVKERVSRVANVLREIGADFALLTSHDAVCYATGHIGQIELGPSPFAGGPVLAMVGRDGNAGLLRSNADVTTAADFVEQEVYDGLVNDHEIDRVAQYLAGFKRLAGRLRLGGRIAVERATFPSSISDLVSSLAVGNLVSVDDALWRARAIKTERELQLLRRAAHVAAAGQMAARHAVRSERSEIEVFGDIRAVMEQEAGERCAVYCDLVSGIDRTANIGGCPSGRLVGPRDPLIVDLAPRVGGYWGDSCGSFCLGNPTDAYLRMFSVVREALDLAASEMRPGLSTAAFDNHLRTFITANGYRFAHHSGHGIGTSVHEYPRIVPYDQGTFESGMMIMVEPGAYHPDIGGIRLEWMFEIIPSGARTVAEFPMHPSI
ncbi:Xaa-Pro peptidase family protein [Rhizobium sp. 18055]|uniref:M24 family metallopeptidase n=1 Tax=Rhizobium sp. 18055 TaxID=2681403 RepID=UPI0013576317|nr:Xaa-Pro peptidase family protein [Rhizobium sp. 18055]